MLTTIQIAPTLRMDVPPEEVGPLLAQPGVKLWLDFDQATPEEVQVLEDCIHLHPLAMEDILNKNQRPKLDRYDGYHYLVIYQLALGDGGGVQRTEIDTVIGHNYLVTSHDEPVEIIDGLRQHCYERRFEFGAHPLAFLVYRLADGLVDGYFPLVDYFQERLDGIEEQALDPNGNVLGEIFALRKSLLIIRNTVEPTRDVFNVLARRDESVLDEGTVLYFNDVYDHLLRISTRVDGLRDLASAALETHLSVQNNELNRTVERLTAVTFLLMAVTLVTGFCGMNVEFPGKEGWSGLGLSVFFMVVTGIGALYFCRRQGWL